MDEAAARPMRFLDLDNRPDSRRVWLADIRSHLDVLIMLARKDFHTRYKRASLGIVWAVLLPLVQAAMMAIVFSRVIRVGAGHAYAIHVMAGIITFAYFSAVTQVASTSIVDGTALTEKVWFPRALLVIVPVLSNLVGLIISLLLLLAAMPIFGAKFGLKTLLLIPGTLLLVGFAIALSLVLSALHVYFRDVRFLVQAALTVWIYLTPVIYSPRQLGRLADLIYANPLTGVVLVMQIATDSYSGPWKVPVAVTLLATVTLFAIGFEAQRRHDRLFVDML